MGDKERTLYMTFKNSFGQACTISADDPREDLEESEIITFMNLVIAKNIFIPKGYDITTAVSAKVVNKDTVEFDLEV